MLVYKTITSLREALNRERANGKTIGFVPTMGALHAGHLSLVERSRSENDVTVVSIFVNPTQFNNKEDLKNYPRMPEADLAMLTDAKADLVFLPEIEEVYTPEQLLQKLPSLPASLSNVMEGAFRPGHFDGVVQIVYLLFEIVKPHKAYFGEKDFQQLAVIRFMTEYYKLGIEIIGCPTYRESNGLAMSSRNLRLSPQQFDEASNISKALYFIRDHFKEYPVSELKKKAREIISSQPSLTVEYLEIADANTLEPVKDTSLQSPVRAFAAVFCDGVRLIDNVEL